MLWPGYNQKLFRNQAPRIREISAKLINEFTRSSVLAWTSCTNASLSTIELVVSWISLAASGLICSSDVKLVDVAILEIKLVGTLAVTSEKANPMLENININEQKKIFKFLI